MRPAGILVRVAGLAFVAGCATYQAAPLDPEAHRVAFNRRGANDSLFRDFLVRTGDDASLDAWRPSTLALAMLFYQSAIAEARGRYFVAQAGEITAGSRERVGLAGAVDYDIGGHSEPSPWGALLGGTFTVELGGNRAARQAAARSRTLQAEAALHDTAWQLVRVTREATLAVVAAGHAWADDSTELTLLDSLVPVVEARYAEGAVSMTDLSRMRSEVQASRMSAAAGGAAFRAAESQAATAAGLPLAALRGLPVRGEAGRGCGPLADLSRDSLQILALGARWNVLEALAGYQAAEGDLRIEISKQRPDLQLGPGLIFDHGVTRFLVAFQMPRLPGGNHGPIAEAEARRLTQASRVAAVQEEVLSEVDVARDACAGLLVSMAVADSLATAAAAQEALSLDAYRRGEWGRAAVALARLGSLRAARARRAMEDQLALARSHLEGAAGRWVTEPPRQWPDLLAEPARPDQKENN
jgi:cobalt-zinc-cadmium efflux system outer membrane protein